MEATIEDCTDPAAPAIAISSDQLAAAVRALAASLGGATSLVAIFATEGAVVFFK